jgi:hypothetical protein
VSAPVRGGESCVSRSFYNNITKMGRLFGRVAQLAALTLVQPVSPAVSAVRRALLNVLSWENRGFVQMSYRAC